MNWIGILVLLFFVVVLIIRISELSSSVKLFEAFVAQCVTHEDLLDMQS